MKYLAYILFLFQIEKPIVMLFPKSSYEEYELGKNYKFKNYKGIFFDGKYAIIRDTKLSVSQGYDSCGETDPEIKKIDCAGNDSCLLILDIQNLKNHIFKPFSINNGKAINPGFSQKITLNDTEYTFLATGLKGEFKDDPFLNVKNYKLYVTSIKNGKLLKQILVNVSKYDERHPAEIYLSGDIDGDDKLDIVVEGGDHYAGSLYYLYLSSKAKPLELMGKAFEYQFSGC